MCYSTTVIPKYIYCLWYRKALALLFFIYARYFWCIGIICSSWNSKKYRRHYPRILQRKFLTFYIFVVNAHLFFNFITHYSLQKIYFMDIFINLFYAYIYWYVKHYKIFLVYVINKHNSYFIYKILRCTYINFGRMSHGRVCIRTIIYKTWEIWRVKTYQYAKHRHFTTQRQFVTIPPNSGNIFLVANMIMCMLAVTVKEIYSEQEIYTPRSTQTTEISAVKRKGNTNETKGE